ncbi:MAG: hypothetical protein J4432_01415 [DPANN group archaeon]|nr:hypothetical protein [DPANN group archaeon]
MRRGIIFTMDLMLAVTVVAAIVGFAIWELEEVNSRANELEFRKMDRIASDLAHYSVKVIFTEQVGDITMPNAINSQSQDFSGKLGQFYTNVFAMLADTRYSAQLSLAGQAVNELNCEEANNIVVAKRLVVDLADNVTKWLEVKICD